MINLTVHLPTRKSPSIFINIAMWEHCTPDRSFDVAKFIWALVNAVMNLQAPKKVWNFLIS
jgi:hypothetical protein